MALRRRDLLLLALACAAGTPRAQDLNEARVKAKLVVTLARFTQWPATTFVALADPVTICVLHRSEALMAAFNELAGQTVAGRPLRITSVAPGGMSGCQVIFVHDSSGAAGVEALAALANAPALTIGETDAFAAAGGMVQFANVNDAIRMDINLRAIRAVRLDLSSRVLQLARRVRE
jgi:hypothetical protein